MERREIVQALSDYLGVNPNYLRVPSFAYEIKTDEETYTIDRDGIITTSAGRVVTLDEIVNPKQPAENSTVEESLQSEDNNRQIDSIEIEFPLEEHTGTSLQNIVNMLASKQHLIMMAFNTDSPFMDTAFARDLALQEDTSSVYSFSEAFDAIGPDRCPGFALDFDNDTVVIRLTAPELTPDRITAFRDLVALINEAALRQKRASFKQSQDDNPKYALRTWLTRLGMNGDEYKESRKVLLGNLRGSGAYRMVGEQDE